MRKRDAGYFGELLYDLLDGVPKEETLKIIRHFLEWMERQGAPALVPKLLEAYQEVALAKEGIAKVEIKTAREIPELTKHIKHLLKDKEAVLEIKIDPGIIGGAIIQIDDLRIDASLQGRINELKKAMVYGIN